MTNITSAVPCAAREVCVCMGGGEGAGKGPNPNPTPLKKLRETNFDSPPECICLLDYRIKKKPLQYHKTDRMQTFLINHNDNSNLL